MRNTFTISESDFSNNTVVLRLSGSMDAQSTPLFVRRCQDMQAKEKNLVVNMEKVTFIASSGVGSILAMVEEYGNTLVGLEFYLSDLSEAVEAVIKLLNLDQFLVIYATESEALTALKAA